MPDRGWNTTQKWGKSSPANLQSWCQIPSVDLTLLKSASKWPCPVTTYLLKGKSRLCAIILASPVQKCYDFPVWTRIAIPPLTSLHLYLINYSLHEVKLPLQRWIQKQCKGIEFHSHSMPNSLRASFTQVRPLPLWKGNTSYRHFFPGKDKNTELIIWEWQQKWPIKALFNMKFRLFSTSSLTHYEYNRLSMLWKISAFISRQGHYSIQIQKSPWSNVSTK